MRVGSPSSPTIGRGSGGIVFPIGSGGSGGTAPANTVAPSISGTAQVGSTLTYHAGTWTGSPTPSIGIQWLAAGIPISGAVGTTYVPVTGDVGKAITVEETASNSAGIASATSAATAAVTAASGGYTPALKFNDNRNSMYLPLAA
jgi:hypothetical protein